MSQVRRIYTCIYIYHMWSKENQVRSRGRYWVGHNPGNKSYNSWSIVGNWQCGNPNLFPIPPIRTSTNFVLFLPDVFYYHLAECVCMCVRNTSWKTLELRLLAQILEQIFKFFFFFFFFFSFFFCFCSQGIRFSMIAICWRSIPSTRYYPGIFPTHYVNSLPLALSPLYPTSPLVHSIARSCSGSQRNWASWMTTTQYELISLTPTPLLPLYNPPLPTLLALKKMLCRRELRLLNGKWFMPLVPP